MSHDRKRVARARAAMLEARLDGLSTAKRGQLRRAIRKLYAIAGKPSPV